MKSTSYCKDFSPQDELVYICLYRPSRGLGSPFCRWRKREIAGIEVVVAYSALRLHGGV